MQKSLVKKKINDNKKYIMHNRGMFRRLLTFEELVLKVKLKKKLYLRKAIILV